MSAVLSRRLARLKMFPPIRDLVFAERRDLYLAVHTVTDFDDLSAGHRDLIVAAELARDSERARRQRNVAAPSRGVGECP